ncbi:protein YIPF5 homolog [Ananas comosus]|uniref:Protein YIP n=2 Tax=Ananas comosus TaxID=4615 RepID=A0A6P5GSL8_ANACO|nr:protein YIPF5 homolog [Ananas comosus]
MSKEFAVPPVVFPSGAASPNLPQHRRHAAAASAAAAAAAAAPFQPPRPSPNPSGPPNPALPFMSFDIGSAAASSSSAAPIFSGPISAASSASFEDEPPLLEELGINTRQIWRKTTSILNPVRVNPNLHEDADLSGPFLFLMAFGLFQLLAGKFHFGIILGWVTVAALFLYVVFNMLAGRNGNLDLYRCVSLVGYCMLPMVIFSAVSLFVPHEGVLIFGLGAVFVLWSTRVCARLLVELASCGDDHRGLIAYACWLVYMLFSLLVIF